MNRDEAIDEQAKAILEPGDLYVDGARLYIETIDQNVTVMTPEQRAALEELAQRQARAEMYTKLIKELLYGTDSQRRHRHQLERARNKAHKREMAKKKAAKRSRKANRKR